MMDLFFCEAGHDILRLAMADLCSIRWNKLQGVVFNSLTPLKVGCIPSKFQSERRKHANAVATTEFYILADDDCLMMNDDSIKRAEGILRSHPQFAILTPLPTNAKIGKWTPEDYTPFEDDEVMEHHSCGGVRFCRHLPDMGWPLQLRAGYDNEQCEWLRKNGFKVGYFKTIRMNHLGEGFSTVWNRK